MKDDSGSYAVFTEQGSASQMTADAQDKQQMQFPLTPRSKWKTHRRY